MSSLLYDKYVKYKKKYLDNTPKIMISDSSKAGRGIIANKYIKKGEIIEECPYLEDYATSFQGNDLYNYIFQSHNDPNKMILLLGFGSLYNHDNNNNAYYINNEKKKNYFNIIALRDIVKNEEICINYGEGYFTSRNITIK